MDQNEMATLYTQYKIQISEYSNKHVLDFKTNLEIAFSDFYD